MKPCLTFVPAFLAAACCLLAGCSGLSSLPDPSAVAGVPLNGIVHGGQQPVSGAIVQLYAVGASGDGSAPTALLIPTVHSDANGAFSITGLYTCPSSSTLVYITATGGNPGLAGGTNNAALAMMSALGACGTLSSSTVIQINEVTTVAAAAALAPFMTAPYNVGSSSADAAGLSAAFTNAAAFANVTTGTSPGAGQAADATATTPGVPVSTIYTLANIVAACVNTAGGTASDTSTPCGKLFSLTGSPADTLSAIIALEKTPAAYDTASLYALASATGPFQPQLSAAPADFGISETVPTGGSTAVRTIPATVYEGATLWVTSTTADCLYGSPSVIQLNGTSYTTGGIVGCGRISGTVPSGLGFGMISGKVLTSSSGQTYNINYPFYVNVVPKPDTTIAFSPTTLYWIGTAGSAGYTQVVTLKNSTTGTITLGTPMISGSFPSAFSIVGNTCGAQLTNSATCTMTVQFFPPETNLVTASLVILGNNGTVSATVALAGTGAN
jgi:hypothetical protein